MRNSESDERRKDNLNHVTGRVHGKFVVNGEPRGGGQHKWVDTEILTFYEAVHVSTGTVFDTLGIGDNGMTPYAELSPAVEPRRVQRVTLYDGDRLIERTLIDLPTES
jgi:hypothetical protein